MRHSDGICQIVQPFMRHPGGGAVLPINGLYGEAPPKGGTFLRVQVYTQLKRVGISQVEVYERVGQSAI